LAAAPCGQASANGVTGTCKPQTAWVASKLEKRALNSLFRGLQRDAFELVASPRTARALIKFAKPKCTWVELPTQQIKLINDHSLSIAVFELSVG